MTEPVHRPVGLETEYGVLQPGNPYANAVAMSTRVVAAYAARSRPGLTSADGAPVAPVRWDYEGEDPLADLRGGHLTRAGAHPSMLTDDPTRPAPSGDAAEDLDLPPAPWGARPRPGEAEAALPRATTAVLANGARLYVDHAHPEYASPEVLSPLDALTWDRAGEVIARRAMTALAQDEGTADEEVVLYKNNVDGKGAAYGSHESYLVRRDLPVDLLVAALIPFLVTRPVIAGAGRVGIGQRSERAGFQISQRADYVQTDIGLQTTFNRPIVNTRDEPHADATRWRRLHVINGDANRLDTPIYLKVATTNLLLWYLERARGEDLGTLTGLAELALVRDPVEEHWAMSHDTSLSHELVTASGPLTALVIQRRYLDLVRTALEEDAQAGAVTGPDTRAALALWDEVLGGLETYAAALGTPHEAAATAVVARDVEWVAKKQLCEALRARTATGWQDERLAALDIQWADLRAGKGIAEKLIAAGRTRRLVTDAEVERAADTPPSGTRAAVRGRAVAGAAEVVAASWTSLVLDVPGSPSLMRLALPDVACDEARAQALLEELRTAAHPDAERPAGGPIGPSTTTGGRLTP
ncbi:MULTISPECIES: proteasome accessory factor PafA2 family protein [Actinomyces]|uniref:Proteasome accessory factor PafA2 family protein n=1 Tax=Actinomyces respiraculi TaxID=2744574 RepID=A0A7T0LIW0_9ACTO|nr:MULTISPECIES: proteasome accessory factor PafA2 family protein [Actinomyces]QPL04507.1 proteasome accessory factor PafA2 family protein [Actinomyces respiraculi]